MKKKLAILIALVCICLLPLAVKADYPDQAKLDKKVNEIIEFLDLNGKSDYEIIFRVYNYICQNVKYDWAATEESSWDGESIGAGQLAYEALCLEKAVCNGISKAVKLLLNKMNIPCETVVGSYNGIAHAWNLVKLNGKWYYMDATKDLEQTEYSAFLKCGDDFTDHSTEYFDGIAEADPDDYPISDTSYADTVPSEMETYEGFAFNKGLGDITIYAYTGKDKNVTVPAKIKGRHVKRITQYFIQDNDTMESLAFSEGIEELSMLFVGHCSNLKSVSIPSTLQYPLDTGIFSIAFGFVDYCPVLETITVAEGNPYLCVIDGVLYNKEKTSIFCYPTNNPAKSVRVPDGVKAIDGSTFENNPFLESVTLPDSVEYIGPWAFNNCGALKSVNIPENCVTIDEFAFHGTALTQIHIPAATTNIRCPFINETETLKTITVDKNNPVYYAKNNVLYSYDGGLYAYAPKKSNTSFTVPAGVTAIMRGAFSHAYNLQTVSFPDSLTNIGDSAFYACSNLKEIAIPDSVTTIESSTFFNCERIAKLEIPASVTTIGEYVLANTEGAVIIGKAGSAAEKWAKKNGYAFLEKGADWNLSGTCGKKASWTLSEDGCLQISGTGKISNGPQAWDKYRNLIEKVIISDGVTSIGKNAFQFCRNLKQVSIPSGVTAIGDDAFLMCDRLPSVYIPESVISVESGFRHCSDLVRVIVPGDTTEFISAVFDMAPNVVLYVQKDSKAYQYAIDWSLKYKILDNAGITLPQSLKEIASKTFAGIAADIIFIPDTVTKIAADAFDAGTIIVVSAGSYAESWAAGHGFEYITR